MSYRDFASESAQGTGAGSASITLAADSKTQFIIRGIVVSTTGGTTFNVKLQYTPATQLAGGEQTLEFDKPAPGESDMFLGIQCALNTRVVLTVTGTTKTSACLTYNAVKVQF